MTVVGIDTFKDTLAVGTVDDTGGVRWSTAAARILLPVTPNWSPSRAQATAAVLH